MAELSTSTPPGGLRWINGAGSCRPAAVKWYAWGPGKTRRITRTMPRTPPPAPSRPASAPSPTPGTTASGLGLPGHHSPGAGFEAPFEMLAACHERVQRSLALLGRLVAHGRAHGADAQVRQAAADVVRYFSLAAPQHHADEERHVLPRLAADPRPEVRAAVQQILDDHAAFARLWSALGPALAAVHQGGPADWPRIAGLAEAFTARHADHLRLEDGLLFPAAAQGLAPPDLAAMGREMAARRRAA